MDRIIPPPPRTLYDVLRLHQLGTDIAGLTHYKSTGSPGNIMHRATVVRGLNFTRLLLTELVCLVVYSSLPQSNLLRGSFILDYGPRICLAATALNLVVVTILDATKYQTHAKILDKLHSIDKKLEIVLGSRPDLAAQRRDIWLATAFTISCLLFLLFITPVILASEINNLTSIILMSSIGFVYNIPYALIFGNYMIKSYLITKRFRQINQLLVLRLNTSNRRNFIWVRELPVKNSDTAEFVQNLAEVHADLARTVDLLSNYHWIQIILISAVVIGFTTFNMFSLYRLLCTGDSVQFVVVLEGSLWNVYYGGLLVALLVRCSLVGVEAGRTVPLIYKALNNVSDRRTVESLRIFARQMYRQPVRVKFYFYDGDFRTLFSALGTITTYLIILLQFDSMAPT